MSVDTIDYARAREEQQETKALGSAIRPFVDASSAAADKVGLASSSAPIRLAREPDFRLGALTVRPSLCEVQAKGGRQRLQPRVMQVLVALARAEGRVVSRDALIETCWGGRIVGEDAINRCIGRLRRLADTCEDGFSIETVARVGYRLNAVKSGASSAVTRPSANALNLGGAFALVAAALAIGAGAVLASR
jgi:DNA-binding winged helix-turn-helix (wHTH) protein